MAACASGSIGHSPNGGWGRLPLGIGPAIAPSHLHSPIVLLTSQVMARDYARFQQMAVVGVIPKPFDPVTLGSQIATLLEWPEGACLGYQP